MLYSLTNITNETCKDISCTHVEFDKFTGDVVFSWTLLTRGKDNGTDSASIIVVSIENGRHVVTFHSSKASDAKLALSESVCNTVLKKN